MIVLGIDPGLERVGFGVVRRTGSKLEALEYGLIKTPPVRLPDRLAQIHDEVSELMERVKPDALATERLFFATNRTTAMDVAKALGVIILAGRRSGLEWAEYAPPEVKLSVAGNGAAAKNQVAYMVVKLLGLAETPKPDDVADALAIAITHALRAPIHGPSYSQATNFPGRKE